MPLAYPRSRGQPSDHRGRPIRGRPPNPDCPGSRALQHARGSLRPNSAGRWRHPPLRLPAHRPRPSRAPAYGQRLALKHRKLASKGRAKLPRFRNRSFSNAPRLPEGIGKECSVSSVSQPSASEVALFFARPALLTAPHDCAHSKVPAQLLIFHVHQRHGFQT